MKEYRPIRVLFVVTTVDGYGADKSILYNIIYLKRAGKIDPLVILPAGGLIEETLRREDIRYRVCDFKSWTKGYKFRRLQFLKPVFKKIYNYLKAVVLVRALGKMQFDVVHTNTFTTDFGMLLARLLKAKHVMHIREIPHEQFNFEFEYPETKLYKLVSKTSEFVLCNSDYTYNYFAFKFNKSKLKLVANPVFDSLSEERDRSKPKGNKVKFILAGRFEPSKNHFDVLHASKYLIETELKNFEVHIFGSGPLETRYRSFIRKAKLEQYVFLHSYNKTLFSDLRDYDVGIVSSQYEAFGRITVEFMINGLPVIGNETGNTPYLINNGENGYIYKFKEPVDLARKMTIFLGHNSHDLIKRMGDRALESVSAIYSYKNSSEALCDAYRSCLR